MDIKQKAKELIELFQLAPDGEIFMMSKVHSKKCALLAVEELLSVIEYPSPKYLFYLEVKKEIENNMKTVKLTSEQYLKAIKLGYYEPIKCISVFKKIVKHYKVCGRTEELLIEIKNK